MTFQVADITRILASLEFSCTTHTDGDGAYLEVGVPSYRLDVALAAEAHGVHLREDSLAIDDARRLRGRPFLVGRSVHAPATAARARSADYLITGSVFETASKPGRPASLGS